MANKWTDEKRQFLKDNVKGITEKELLERFNKHFNSNHSLSSVLNEKSKLKLSSGIVGGQFPKGNESFNKGKKWSEYMSKEGQKNSLKTTFKKGNKPHNRREVFEERVSKDGYIKIKVQDGKGNNNWQFKHRYIYEQENGKIPKDYIVSFADGNIRNFDKDNLILVSRVENLILNQYDLRANNTKITKMALNIAKVICKVNDKKRKDD